MQKKASKKRVSKKCFFYIGKTDDFELTKDNYYSIEANRHYCSVHTYLDFFGSIGSKGCEARALATLKGEYKKEDTDALLVGSFVDSYFEGTLDFFKFNHREIYTKTGTLRAPFKQAESMIDRVSVDKVFMDYMSGEKQVIMTGNLFSLDWKIKIDSLLMNGKEPIGIVDLKTTGKPLTQTWYSNDYGKVGFIEYWGYDIQLALYQKIVEINTGKQVPCFVAGIVKDDNPDFNVIYIPQQLLDTALNLLKMNCETFKNLITEKMEVVGCGLDSCEYCKSTKVLEKAINYNDLIDFA